MKKFTDIEQTKKLIEMGFPAPALATVIPEVGYSIGELMVFMGEHLCDISSYKMGGLPVSYALKYKKNLCGSGWKEVRGELVDKLCEACIELKSENII